MIIAVLIVGLVSAVPKIMGYQTYDVLTGSMEPELPVGSLILVETVDPALLVEGDIITFERSMQGTSLLTELSAITQTK